MLNVAILLVGYILFHLMALPALLARFYDKKVKESIRAEGYVYPRPQTCWLLTRAGITVLVLIILVIPPFILISRYFVTELFDIHRVNDTWHVVVGFLICIGCILITIAFWWSPIADFKKHKDDYIRLSEKEIKFRNGDKMAEIPLDKILKFETGRRGYNIHVENDDVILISYTFINTLIGSNELKAKLEELASSLSN
jgi:hypothetical protein